MDHMKPRPQMKRRPFRKHRPDHSRSDHRRTGYNGSGGGNGAGDSGGGVIKRALGARDKYLGLARDALADGDRVMAENYFQHADHYLRIINSAEPEPARAAPQASEPQQNGQEAAGNTQIDTVENLVNPESHIPAFLRGGTSPRTENPAPPAPEPEDNYNS